MSKYKGNWARMIHNFNVKKKKKKKKKNCKDATHLNCFIFIKPHYS